MILIQLLMLIGHLHLSGDVIRCGFKNGHQKEHLLLKIYIYLCAQKLLPILSIQEDTKVCRPKCPRDLIWATPHKNCVFEPHTSILSQLCQERPYLKL